MKPFIRRQLAAYAKRVLARETPYVIGVTGSVGKSSTKEAIAAVLRAKFAVRSSPGNYNTEFGLPLAILALPAPASRLGWIGTLLAASRCASSPDPEFPKTLVLEMASDRPGDIAALCDIARPDLAVVTAIGESHLAAFGSVDELIKEKRVIVERLAKDGVAVLCRDDEPVWNMRTKVAGKTVGYGFDADATVRATEAPEYHCAYGEPAGTHFKVSAGGATVPMMVPGVLGVQPVYAVLAAVAVGLERGMNLIDIGDALRGLVPLPGRMRAIPGIKRTMLIDDTYNAAPRSLSAALSVLRDIRLPSDSCRRFAVLGDMLELGAISEEAHIKAGHEAAESADVLVFVGERMGDAARGAKEAGAGEDRVFHFATTAEAGMFVQEHFKQGDVVLVKGSRGMQMEAVVKELMEDPMSAPALLVGHHDEWKL